MSQQLNWRWAGHASEGTAVFGWHGHRVRFVVGEVPWMS
jgi:hypothetical protein